jgi:hypothetical protein
MNISPRNIYKAKNSDGSTSRIEEWDFATLSNLELVGQAAIFVFCLLLISIASPLLTLLAFIGFSGRFNFLYILSLIFGGYFLYDCYQGWLALAGLNLFFEESTISIIVRLNIASVCISFLLMVFGSAILNLIVNPIKKYSEDDFMGKKSLQLRSDLNSFERNKQLFNVFIIATFIITFFFSGIVLKGNSGWVDRNMSYVSPEDREEARRDSIKRAIGDFNSQEERDAYFREMERRYGN